MADGHHRLGLLPSTARHDALLLLASRGLRAFGDGLISLLLPYYLIALGFDALAIGLIITATLLGSSILTLLAGLTVHRFSDRAMLMGAALLMTFTGVAFVLLHDFWLLLIIAFVGTLNPSAGDASVFATLEQTKLARAVADRDRTALLARYSLVGSLAGAGGAFAARFPDIVRASGGLDDHSALQAAFLLYAGIGILALVLYRRLPISPVEASSQTPLHRSRRTVLVLASLLSLDAFAGGLVLQSMLALWIFQRFDLSLSMMSTLFFASGVLTAISYLAASSISRRIGLLKTMVFTHIPASICLALVPFMPNTGLAITLLLIRSALSEMDVPARRSYVMAVVTPEERRAAVSLTTVSRTLAATAGPALTGSLLLGSSFGYPLIIAGGLKIVYDLLLFGMFHSIRPPEEHSNQVG